MHVLERVDDEEQMYWLHAATQSTLESKVTSLKTLVQTPQAQDQARSLPQIVQYTYAPS